MRVTGDTPKCNDFQLREGPEMEVNAPYLGITKREKERKKEQRINLVFSSVLSGILGIIGVIIGTILG